MVGAWIGGRFRPAAEYSTGPPAISRPAPSASGSVAPSSASRIRRSSGLIGRSARRSGRRSAVRRSEASRRQRRTAAWFPPTRTSGNGPAAERGGAGVLRVLEQAVRERLLGRGGVVDRARAGAGSRRPRRPAPAARRRSGRSPRSTAPGPRDRGSCRPRPRSAGRSRMRCSSRARSAARACRKTSPAGSRRIVVVRGPRRASSAAATGSGTQDHAGSPAVRRVVHAPVAPETPLAEIVDVDVGEPLLADAPGNARRERPFEHRREEGQQVDPHVSPPRAAAPARLPGRRLGAPRPARRPTPAPPFPWRDQRGRLRGGRATGSSTGAAARSRTASSTTISPRSGAKTRTMSLTTGRSNSPDGPAAHDVHLGRCHPVDVGDLAEERDRPGRGPSSRSPRASTRRPARGPRRGRPPSPGRRRGGLRRRPVADLAELEAPARPVLDRRRGDDRQRRTARPRGGGRCPATNRSSGRSVSTSTRTTP